MSQIDEEAAAEELFAKGAAFRASVLGQEHVARDGGFERGSATDMRRMMTQVGWGTIWPRGVLELKTRSLITVAMLIALDRPHELRTHLKGALNNGATPEELHETMLHAILYCGFPAAIDAERVLDDVLAERAEAPE
jgi:4-carboxymuconolactone decarboxylase